MDNEFIEVIGSQETKPAETDTTSSQYYVYERKDIQPYEEKDDDQNVTYKGWKYLERKIPREQYTVDMSAKVKELENEIKTMAETTMLSLVDLYELQLEAMGELEY